jgi:hypothetical protein
VSISRITSGGADADSAAISGVQENDLVVVFAHNNSTSTIPSVPTNWLSAGTVQATGAGTDCALRVGYRFVPSGGLTSTDTWSNASRILYAVLRGANLADPIGNISLTNDVGTFVRYPALTLTSGEAGQWLLGFAGRAGGGLDLDMDNAISGMTLIVERPAGAGTDAALHSTEGVRSTDWPDTDVTGMTNSFQFCAAVVEILAADLDSGDNPSQPELSVTYTDTSAYMALDGFDANDSQDQHIETTWQITTAADTGFAAPIVDVTSETDLLAHNEIGVLTPSTDYIARARTSGLYGDSEWSDTVAFTTESASPQPEPPVLSDPPTNIEDTEVTLTVDDFAHSEGTTTEDAYDPETNDLPYPIARQWQVTVTADTGFAADPMTWDTGLATNLDQVRTFDALTANTTYRARTRVQDGKYGTTSEWSNVVVFTTDATPVDLPGTPEIFVYCNAIDAAVVVESSDFVPFGAETHAQTQWRARASTRSSSGDAPISSTELTSFTGWANLPAGTWYFDVRHQGSNGKWSAYSAAKSCLIYERPPVLTITSPVSGVVIEANQAVTWTVPGQPDSPDVAFDFTVQLSTDDAASFATVQTSTSTTYNFSVAGRADGPYWVRVRACYPAGHEAEGRCGDWSYVKLALDRSDSLSVSYDFRGLTSFDDVPGNPTMLWDTANVTWSLVDRCLGSSGPSIGLIGKNNRQLQTRQSVLAFTDVGKPVAGRFTTTFAVVPTESSWYGWRFAHADYMRGGIGYRVLGTGATDRSGLQFVARGGKPWGFFGQHCVCQCSNGQFSSQCCTDSQCVPCATCHNMPATRCNQHLNDLAYRARTQPSIYWDYGVGYFSSKIERWGRRQGSAVNTHFFSSDSLSYEGDRRRGFGVGIRPPAPDDDDLTCGACVYQLTFYTAEVDVRREGTQWRVRSRVVGPGLDPEAGWQQDDLLSLGELEDTDAVPCGYCGLALWHLASNLTNDHGVLFQSFSASGLEYETCAVPEPECENGHALIRILSQERHPSHSVVEYMVIGSVPCPEEVSG